MGQMPLVWFSKINSCNATNKHDINGGTWPQAMCSYIFIKRSKPLTKSSWTNTITKGVFVRQMILVNYE